MNISIHELAQLAGVSTRTLRYYDEIGLLRPATIAENGYRNYSDKQLVTLQQILFFRELEFPLEKIKEIMSSPYFDTESALKDQRSLLELKKKRVEEMLVTINKTIINLKGGEHMSNDDSFSPFNDPTYQKHKDEVIQRWGNTDAYKQSVERVGKMSKADLERVKAESEDIRVQTGKLMQEGFSFDSSKVQQQIDRFYNHLYNFYDPSYALFKGLGEMYVSDPRFTKVYEDITEGLAQFMKEAMAFYADKNLKK